MQLFQSANGKVLEFMNTMKRIAEAIRETVAADNEGKTILNLIDEYNYAKYTKGWI